MGAILISFLFCSWLEHKEMRRRGHRLTRYADDWVVSCGSRKEAEKAMADARRVLATLGVTLNEQKTRIFRFRMQVSGACECLSLLRARTI